MLQGKARLTQLPGTSNLKRSGQHLGYAGSGNILGMAQRASKQSEAAGNTSPLAAKRLKLPEPVKQPQGSAVARYIPYRNVPRSNSQLFSWIQEKSNKKTSAKGIQETKA